LPEVDAVLADPTAGRNALMALDRAAVLGADLPVRFALLVCGKEPRMDAIGSISDRLRVSNACREMAELVAALRGPAHRINQLRPIEILRVLEQLDMFRRPERLDEFLLACEADRTVTDDRERASYPQARMWRRAAAAARAVDGARLAARGFKGAEIAHEMRRRRTAQIAEALADDAG